MGYRKSRARIDLEHAFADVQSRLRRFAPKIVHPDIREYGLSAAIFLGHAQLENYVADIFSAIARCAQVSPSNGSTLPSHLQAHLFVHKGNLKSLFGTHQSGGSERDLLQSMSTLIRGRPGSYLDDARTFAAFTGKDILTANKYPSEDNLKKVFVRIGVLNVFGDLSAQLKQDAAAMLQSLSSLRTQLAHTGAIPGISLGDVRNKLKETLAFAGAIDRVVYKAVAAKYGDPIWKAHAS